MESSNCIWLSQWWLRLFPIFCRKNNTSIHIFKHKSLSKSSESLKIFLFFLFHPTQILCFLKCLAHVWPLLRILLQVLQTAKIPSISDSNCIHLFIHSFIKYHLMPYQVCICICSSNINFFSDNEIAYITIIASVLWVLTLCGHFLKYFTWIITFHLYNVIHALPMGKSRHREIQ